MDADADVTRLSVHLGALYFHPTLILRGHWSKTPKWYVSVCSGPARSESQASSAHAAMIQQRITDRQWRQCGLCGQYFMCVFSRTFCTCVGGWEHFFGGQKKRQIHTGPERAAVSAMQHLSIFLFWVVDVVYVVCLDASWSCLLDERITGAAGNRRMILWWYSAVSGGETLAIIGSL